MSALNSMKAKLRPLNLYKLDEENLINAELSAYAAGLDIINDRLEELERECFVSTATSFGLSTKEKIFNSAHDSADIQKRRDWILFRGALRNSDFTNSGIKNTMSGCGMNVKLYENVSDGTFGISCLEITDDSATNETLQKRAEEFLPAHLLATFDFGSITWDIVAQNDMSFDEMDAKDLTWDEIDNY